ncbi:MAG: hypothetical protein H6Q20_347 [Bacteroidetes bacterium]|jgi:hypothetical protein|nr:hypothetical protein [Bacteroidota bacterium]
MITSKPESIAHTNKASMMEAISTTTALLVSSERVGHDTL